MPRLKQTVGLQPQAASRHRRSVINREMWDGWSQGLRADLKRYRPKNGTARHRWATAIDPAVCGWMDVRFLLLMGCSGVHRKKKASADGWLVTAWSAIHSSQMNHRGSRSVIHLLSNTFFTRCDHRQPGWGNLPPLRLYAAVRVGLSVKLLIKMSAKHTLRI